MVTIKVDEATLKEIEKQYMDNIVARNIGYILFCVKTEDLILTAYENKKKAYYKVTLQGKDVLPLAKKYSLEENFMPKKEKIIKESPHYIDINEQIGSDEVGTGDFLLPIVVCAAYIDLYTMKFIKQFNIIDSKKLSDQEILNVIPSLLKKIHYSCKILSTQNYNTLIQDHGFNLNQIKAILHNSCLTKLHKRCPYVGNVYMDKFCEEDKYYEYIKNQEEITSDIIFKEKGETYFPSVALASCIARYFFLIEVDKLNTKYRAKFPLGAAKHVNEFALKFINKYGLAEFNKISKHNFKNYQEVLDAYNQTSILV